METIIIRDARLEDAGRMAEIYEHYVKNTAVSFEYEVPTLEEFQNRMKKTMERYPYLAAEREGVVEGYAYAGPFVGRKAYGWSCELTIYLDKDIQKRGIGRRLYEALTEKLKDMGVTNVYACVGTVQGEDPYLTLNSAQFHEHMGFRTVGTFRSCGYKFDRWYDMVWMEKIIGEHGSHQPPVMPYLRTGESL